MKIITKLLVATLCATAGISPALAQRERTVTDTNRTDPQQQSATPVSQSFKAKYEGGVFGYNRQMSGTISFDDMNRRLVFRNNQQREMFAIPYQSMSAAFADTRSRRPAAATVIGSLPIPYGLGFPALFVRRTYRYLTVQYTDPDTNVSGVTSFKLENRVTLNIALQTLATKAGLTQRGEIYIRRPGEPPPTTTERAPETPTNTTTPPE